MSSINWPAPPTGIGRAQSWMRRLLKACRQTELKDGPDHRRRAAPGGGFYLENVLPPMGGAGGVASQQFRGPWVEGETYRPFDIVGMFELISSAPIAGSGLPGSNFCSYWMWLHPESDNTGKPILKSIGDGPINYEFPDGGLWNLPDGFDMPAGFLPANGTEPSDPNVITSADRMWILLDYFMIPYFGRTVTIDLMASHGIKLYFVNGKLMGALGV